MELNKLHETSYLYTPDGFLQIKELLSLKPDGIVKVYAKDNGFVTAKITPVHIEIPYRVSTVYLSNGFTNVSFDSTQYLLATGSSVSASAIVGRNLQSLGKIQEFNTKFSYASLIANMFKYSHINNEYFTRQDYVQCREDLFDLLWTNPNHKCNENIWLQNDKLKKGTWEVYSRWASLANPIIPVYMENWKKYDKASWLRGIMTVGIDFTVKDKLTFNFINDANADLCSSILTELGINHKKDAKRKFLRLDPLGDNDPVRIPYIIIDSDYIDNFMTLVGLMTDESIDHVKRVTKYSATKANKVTTVNRDDYKGTHNFYALSIEPFDPKVDFWILVGGVYVRMYK